MRRNLLLVFLCIAGASVGVYIGFLLFGAKSAPVTAQPLPGSADISTTFRPGDAFPPENYTDQNGDSAAFESFFHHDKPTIFFFAHFGCETCYDLLNFWKTNIQYRLHENVQCVIAMERAGGDVPVEYAGLVKGMKIVFYDGYRWENFYHMQFWPTIVAVDKDGMVTDVQSGFDGTIDYGIMRRYANPPETGK